MRVAIHNHFNLRKLCELDLGDDVIARLERPEPPKPAVEQAGVDAHGNPKWRVVPKAHAHVVEIETPSGRMRLFPVSGNGERYIVTNTPEAVVARGAQTQPALAVAHAPSA